MTTRTNMLTWEQLPPDVNPNSTCQLCGKPFNAHWAGAEKPGKSNEFFNLYFCTECAVEVLPRVIADAVVDTHGTDANAALKCEELMCEFFRRTLRKHGLGI